MKSFLVALVACGFLTLSSGCGHAVAAGVGGLLAAKVVATKVAVVTVYLGKEVWKAAGHVSTAAWIASVVFDSDSGVLLVKGKDGKEKEVPVTDEQKAAIKEHGKVELKLEDGTTVLWDVTIK